MTSPEQAMEILEDRLAAFIRLNRAVIRVLRVALKAAEDIQTSLQQSESGDTITLSAQDSTKGES